MLTEDGSKLPHGFYNLFSKVLRKNQDFNITGILCYRAGNYFQIVEGEESIINQLISNIDIDNRYENSEILFDFPTNKRFFHNSSTELSPSVRENSEFTSFVIENTQVVSTLDIEKRNLLLPFYDVYDSLNQKDSYLLTGT